MTTAVQTPAAKATGRKPPMSSTRKSAFLAGALFIVTFITSIPAAFILYRPLLDHADYIVGPGADTQILWGAFLEVLLVIANIGTALALFRIVKRENETIALGFVIARIIESTFIIIGILSLISVVTLRQDFAGGDGSDAGSFVTVGKSLVALHDWTFLLGPGFVVGIGNGLMLGYLMYRSGLVPRRMAMLGLVGGPLIIATGAAILLGYLEAGSVIQGVATIPEALWELSLGIYLMVKGFRPSPITAELDAAAAEKGLRS